MPDTLTDLQRKTAQAIVNIFETGSVLGEYGRVTLLPGDPGHLTYGRSQTTLASGNLYLLINRYCEQDAAEYAAALRPYLPALQKPDLGLDHDRQLRRLLETAGSDPVMRLVQDEFFDAIYWSPAERQARALGLGLALGVTVIYDSQVHGSLRRIRDRVLAEHGDVATLGEQEWIKRYVDTRKRWLANHANALLRKTVYRMEAFNALIKDKKWDLPLPLSVRGRIIDEASLGLGRVAAVDLDGEERPLFLTSPLLEGADVKALQQALNRHGFNLVEDGRFGHLTARAVRLFQESRGLRADGIVGPATRAELGL
ncbi:MAG TPA: peptidoglycan-binding protein [Candidatus Competibacteraceae bacterium]|nr:peptidoglycan-binding protein [Candidatus Competibacteraceae bacterium]